MTQNTLIFDLGFHNGDDTDFYLKKGFNVIAIEANPNLVKQGEKRFQNAIKENSLILLNKAISDSTGKVKFYIHPKKSDWSSCNKDMAESDGTQAEEISVESISLIDLCEKYGIPRYMKIDVEGCEVMLAKQIYTLKIKPQFVSFETSKTSYAEIFSWLRVSEYKKFQLINQLNHVNRVPLKNRDQYEGKNIEYQFTIYSSGYFGNDLPPDKWLTYDEALTRYIKYKELKFIDNQELALGWLDVHASL